MNQPVAATRGRVIFLAYALGLMGPLTTDALLPALPAVNRAFDITPAVSQQTITLFLVVLAVAQLIVGPITDRLGRLRVVRIAAVSYILAAGLAALAASFSWLLALRLLQAVAVAAITLISRALLRDICDEDELPRKIAIGSAVIATSLIVGPVVGGYGVYLLGWQAPFLFHMLLGLLAFLLTVGVNETMPGRDDHSAGFTGISLDYLLILGNPVFRHCVLTGSLCFCGLFGFISLSGFIVIDGLDIPPQRFGYVTALLAFGHIAGAVTLNRALIGMRGTTAACRRQFRARMMVAGAVICLGSGLLFAFNLLLSLEAGGWSQFLLVIGPMVAYFFGAGFIFPVVTSTGVQQFPMQAATAMSLFNLVFFAMGGSSTWILGRLYRDSLEPLAIFVFLCAVATLLVGWRLQRIFRFAVLHA